jgi:Ca2+-binding RTX toxin-like protein
VVTDADTGKPVSGVKVAFAGLQLTDTTDSLGQYSIPGVPVGTYPQVLATKTGFDRAVGTGLEIVADAETAADFAVRRNWASYGGGGRISSFTGPNFSAFGCGPADAIDQQAGTGWSTLRPTISPKGTRSITVKLPSFVDVSSFGVDPGAVCGDPDSASAKGFKIETSKSGASGSWAVAKTGSFTPGQAHELNLLPISVRKGVRYVRVTITSNQGHAQFMDLAELAVYGKSRPGCQGKPATRVGTEGANTIKGGSGPDVIVGLGGNDKLDGRGGKDVICGGSGNDTLTGGKGKDRLDGGPGNDRLLSRDGTRDAAVKGGSGSDRARKDKVDKTKSVEKLL